MWRCLPENLLLEKAVTIKRFQRSPFGSELKKQTDIASETIPGIRKGLRIL